MTIDLSILVEPQPQFNEDKSKSSIKFKLSEDFIDNYRWKQPNWGPLGYITYKRTYARRIEKENRTEEFFETIRRVVEGEFKIQKLHCKMNGYPWDEKKAQRSAKKTFEKMWNFKFLPPGRGLWIMGTPYVDEKGGMALNNCGFVSTEDIDVKKSLPFRWCMDALMLGVGVGFDTLGAGKIIIQKPIFSDSAFQIPDSREGWVEAFGYILDGYFTGASIPKFDISLIRKRGEPIKGFGGKASGPDPLVELFNNVEEVLNHRIDNKITSTDIVDIFNFIGKCVVAGNVRRSAEIAFGDIHDIEFLDLKLDPEKANSHRWASNNSVVAKVGDDYTEIAKRIVKNGEPGIFWLQNAQNYSRMNGSPDYADIKVKGANPCFSGDAKLFCKISDRVNNLNTINEDGDVCTLTESLSQEFQYYTFNELNNKKVEIITPTGEKVSAKVFKTGNKDTVRLVFTNNSQFHDLVLTPDHVLMTSDGREIHAIDTMNERLRVHKEPINDFDIYWIKLGFIQGDSNLSRIDQNNRHLGFEIYVGKKDDDVRTIFGFPNDNNIKYYTDEYFDDCIKYGFKSVKLPERSLPDIFDPYTKSNKLGNNLELRSFLRGLFSANGSVVKDTRISFKTSCLKLSEQLKYILSCYFDIESYITVNKPKKVMFSNGEYECKESYDINICQFNSIVKFYEEIGFVHQYKMKNLYNLIINRSPKVISIQDNGKVDVFDFTAERIHWGIVNGIVAHNCCEQSLESYELCVRGDTRIQTRHGCYRINDLENKVVEVWNGNKWSTTTIQMTSPKSEIVRVHFSDGSYIDTTKYHEFSAIGSTNCVPKKKKAIELENGDKMPDWKLGEIGCVSEKYAYEYGLMLGDGYIDQAPHFKRAMIVMYDKKTELKDIGIVGDWYKEQTSPMHKKSYARIRMDKYLDLDRCEMLRKNDGLEDWVFEMDKKSILEFIAGWIDTDGNIQKNPNSWSYRIFGKEKNIRDLQLLLRRVGINYATIRVYSKKDQRVFLNNRWITRKNDLYCCHIPSFECAIIPTKLRVIPNDKFVNRYRINQAHPEGRMIDHVSKQKVTKVEYLNIEEPVFCFNEPINHMGVFGNTLTYQCCLVETFPSLHNDVYDDKGNLIMTAYQEFEETLKYAYMYAKTVTLLTTQWEVTNAVMHRNRRIGTSQSGIIDAFVKFGRREVLRWCEKGYEYLRKKDRQYSEDWLCINPSKKITSVKPSGTVSLLPGVSPGIHYPHSEYSIRRIRLDSDSEMIEELIKHGINIVNDPTSAVYKLNADNSKFLDEKNNPVIIDYRTVVAEFPVKEKNFKQSKRDVTIMEQMMNAYDYQRYWADNQVSITVTFKKDEADKIPTVLTMFEDKLKCVSFLPLDDHGYKLPPYEEITKEKYEEMNGKIHGELDFRYVTGDGTGEKFCSTEDCLIKLEKERIKSASGCNCN